MAEVPQTDWNLIHEWEWFRRVTWQQGFRFAELGEHGGGVRAFQELAKIIEANVVLDCACGLGRRAICMAEKGLNVVGSDGSTVAVARASDLARLENVPVTFFQSEWKHLPKKAPHRFDAILNLALEGTAEWQELQASLKGIFEVLKPGGFLMFIGAGEKTPPDAGKRRLEELKKEPMEFVAWSHREGRTFCTKLVERIFAADYVDERYRYVIDDGGATRIQSTIRRRPAYWTWKHWQELIRGAGFCHIETRSYPGYGPKGETLFFNVAWKAKAEPPKIDHTTRNSSYQD